MSYWKRSGAPGARRAGGGSVKKPARSTSSSSSLACCGGSVVASTLADRVIPATPPLLAACLAGYTLVDKEALRHASPLPYLEVVLGPTALIYLLAVLWRRGGTQVRAAVSPGVLVAGVGMFAAYALTLAALRLAPAAAVAAVRECSVVIATGMAAVFLGERVGAERGAGAVAVTVGIVLIAVA